MSEIRSDQIHKFYDLLKKVEEKFPRQTLDMIMRKRLPEQGVYFFFENGEFRENGIDERVVRIGTHAAIDKSMATLYSRLYQHRGARNLTGDHRTSVFRKLVGHSIVNRDKLDFRHWGDKSKKGDREIKDSEQVLEISVSRYLHSMTFIVLEVPGPPSKENDRGFIEENSIALLSNYERRCFDKCSPGWLGLISNSEKVISSGLWNDKCVDRLHVDNRYFDIFENCLKKMNNWL